MSTHHKVVMLEIQNQELQLRVQQLEDSVNTLADQVYGHTLFNPFGRTSTLNGRVEAVVEYLNLVMNVQSEQNSKVVAEKGKK